MNTRQRNSVLIFLGLFLVGVTVWAFGFIYINGKELIYNRPIESHSFQNPNGYYCVIHKGVGYFDADNVPKGAILIKPEPDYTGGDAIKYANINFLRMAGCVK